MDMAIVIIFGGLIGLIASYVKSLGLGLLWAVYLGTAGSIFASLITIYGYLINFFAERNILGMNFNSIAVDVIGAIMFISAARFYNKPNLMSKIGFNLVTIK
jgi:uncharacterized membrane protein YeaQ/YmgE (transglycosylase-associated protein family)